MAADRGRSEGENNLLRRELALRKVAVPDAISHNSVDGAETTASMHGILMLAIFIRFLPEGERFQHHFDVVVVRIDIGEMTTGETDGLNSFAAAPLELSCALKEIRALF